MQVYFHELEKQFEGFQDFIKTFSLRRGKLKSVEEDEEDSTVGEFKVQIDNPSWCLHACHMTASQLHFLVNLANETGLLQPVNCINLHKNRAPHCSV